MSLSIAEVRKIAKLSRIELSEEEENRHADTISSILDFVNTLNEVDTEGVEPTAQVTGLEDVVREDVVHECAHKQDLIKILPQSENNLLKVPAVFEE